MLPFRKKTKIYVFRYFLCVYPSYMNSEYDAVVIGSGPNGLAAAITMQQKNLSVLLIEAKETIGGGMRTKELTLPGFKHDICSAVHPLGASSPFFSTLPLADFGLEWLYPKAALAHPFDDGTAAMLYPSIRATADTLGLDAEAYMNAMKPMVEIWGNISKDLLGPFAVPAEIGKAMRFGFQAIRSAENFAKRSFKGEKARGFFGGLAAHSMLPLDKLISASFGLVLGILGHKVNWPCPKGGSQALANSLANYFKSIGGTIQTEMHIHGLKNIPKSKIKLFDVTPKQLLAIVGEDFPPSYRRRMEQYRYGHGVFKIDWALSEPIPFKASSCSEAGTVHLGGTFEEIANAEKSVWKNTHHPKPYVLLAQPSIIDRTRAPKAQHTAWAYCHVPRNSTQDMTDIIENQVERFAPGFKDVIQAKHTMNTQDMQYYNPNYIGGDINGGVQDVFQHFSRPVLRWSPYTTPIPDIYICSSSTPPGGGVHGMCGFHAAKRALSDHYRIKVEL